MEREGKIVIGAIIAVLSLILVVAMSVDFATSKAGAVTSATETCTPSEAWTETIEYPAETHTETDVIIDKEAWTETVFDHWQRYSWTGGPHPESDPPPFPSADWQGNVEGDPHGVGVEGAYFRSHGNSGRGDWFYLEAVNVVIEHPAVTHEETRIVIDKEAWTEVIEHPAVICDDPTEPTPTDPTDEPTEPETTDPTNPEPSQPEESNPPVEGERSSDIRYIYRCDEVIRIETFYLDNVITGVDRTVTPTGADCSPEELDNPNWVPEREEGF